MLESWEWKEQFNSIQRRFAYVCDATDTTLWEKPFDNLSNTCKDCKKADREDLCRCQQCQVETCKECDGVRHWGKAKSGHKRPPVREKETWGGGRGDVHPGVHAERRRVLVTVACM